MNKNIRNYIYFDENLTFPYVHISTTFYGFSQTLKSTIHLCSCSKLALKNFLLLWPKNGFRVAHDNIRECADLPSLLQEHINDKVEILKQIKFKENICHECNKIIPHEHAVTYEYDIKFRKLFKPYINKKYYEYGIDPFSFEILDNCEKKDILELIEINPKDIADIHNNYMINGQIDFDLIEEKYKVPKSDNVVRDVLGNLWKKLNRQKTKINKVIENEVRINFGYKKLGESWVNETTLYYIIKNIYKDMHVIHHYRPDFLNGMEYDIYIKELSIGVEYQGIQHFEPVEIWGGEKAFAKQKARDEIKLKLSKENNIGLIYFNYDEDITHSLVKNRINSIDKNA